MNTKIDPVISSPVDALEILRREVLASPLYQRVCGMLAGTLEIESDMPKRTGPREPRFLTIGMATCNDYDGFYFTLQAMRMYHPEVLDNVEFLVIDNGSKVAHAKSMKALDDRILANYRYVPYSSHQATAVKDLIFREATGEFVLVMDSHVLVQPGGLAKLIAYLRANPHSNDILHGPLAADALGNKITATHLDSVWAHGGIGQWAVDPRGGIDGHEPFEIDKQGLGLFCCRRAAWPGLNPRLTGYGCEEGYIHDKIRQAGGRALCMPFLVWLHRFERPAGAQYPQNYEDRIRNFMLMDNEMSMDSIEMIRHYREIMPDVAERAIRLTQAEIDSPFHAVDAVYCIWHEDHPVRKEAMRRRFAELAIERKVRWYSGAKTPLDRHIGSVLSHRRILAEAQTQALKSVIIFEDTHRFSPDAVATTTRSLVALRDNVWPVAFLDGPAIAFNQSIYETILTQVPDDACEVARLVTGFYESPGKAMQQMLNRLGVDACTWAYDDVSTSSSK